MAKKKLVIKKSMLIPGAVLIVLAVASLIFFFMMNATVNEIPKDTIANNVYVGNVDVSNMTKKEAKSAIKETIKKQQDEKVSLSADEVESTVTLEELGFQMVDVDELVSKALAYGKKGNIIKCYKQIKSLNKSAHTIEAEYTVDKEDVKKTIETKINFSENQAQNATIKRENGGFVITDGKRGKKVDLNESEKIIRKYFQKEWKPNAKAKISLSTMVDEPDITRKDLERITQLLGTYSTSFTVSGDRGKNVINATRKINGTILMPGEEVSVVKKITPFTTENGYYAAGSYLNGEVVQSIGGGVCQVATTLYNALILAEVEIVERHPHSMTVAYVPNSMDAAIAEGSKDLRFKNATETPIYVEGYTSGGRVVFSVYGAAPQNPNRKVSFASEVLSKTPAKNVFSADNSPIGTIKLSESGHDAVKAQLWKIVKENGVEVSKTVINKSSYRSSVAKWSVGIATDHEEAKAIVQNAIASQDEATIRAAIAQAQALIAAAQQPTTPSQSPQTP